MSASEAGPAQAADSAGSPEAAGPADVDGVVRPAGSADPPDAVGPSEAAGPAVPVRSPARPVRSVDVMGATLRNPGPLVTGPSAPSRWTGVHHMESRRMGPTTSDRIRIPRVPSDP